MTSEQSPNTKDLFDAHLRAIQEQDISAIMRDYADDGVLLTKNGPIQGRDDIMSAYCNFILPLFTDEFKERFNVQRLDVANDVVYLLWDAPDKIELGCETFVYRDGKISTLVLGDHVSKIYA